MGPRQGAHPSSDCIFLKLFSCPSFPEDTVAPAGCRGHKVWGEDDSGPASLGWWGLWAHSPSALCCIPTPSFPAQAGPERVPFALPVRGRGRSAHLSLPKAPLPLFHPHQQNPSPWHRRLLEKESSKPHRRVIVLSAFKPCRMSLCHNFSSLGGAGKTP